MLTGHCELVIQTAYEVNIVTGNINLRTAFWYVIYRREVINDVVIADNCSQWALRIQNNRPKQNVNTSAEESLP